MDVIDNPTLNRPLLISSFINKKELSKRIKNNSFVDHKVTPLIKNISFHEMDKWFFDHSGNLKHESGKFFVIQGMKIKDQVHKKLLYRPIINQPEHGILGLIMKEEDGAKYLLVQLKIEPGNVNFIQVSPTVQATESNYTQVHSGKSVPYLEYFTNSNNSKVIFKQLQSELGNKFYAKRNYNMIAELAEGYQIKLRPDFYWISLGEIFDLLRKPNLINMDLRSIISCFSFSNHNLDNKKYSDKLEDSERMMKWNIHGKMLLQSALNHKGAVNSLEHINAWLLDLKKKKRFEIEMISLNELLDKGWNKNNKRIFNHNYDEFEVNYLKIHIENREVNTWSQPIVVDHQVKLNGFIVKKINGLYHFLAQACEQYGYHDGVEIGPTVHNVSSYSSVAYMDFFQNAKNEKILYSQILSEEGGRFYHCQNQYMIIFIEDEIKIKNGFKWVTLYQLKEMLKNECFVNVEARTIISCVDFGVMDR
ncbi:NDP-hexose 2,3-dehydratase family protein [Chengkuizengella sp. SCS-71B]|uniref:NDP-hexose 2,3-dehydratase family protein n=1 Tax=Chengkuizengella sp. SCS-71B TaxID=3115290 RepID=UPI0032C240BA